MVPDRHPYTTGGIGLLGTAPSQDALSECDTLVMAGTSFPYMEFYPKPGKAKTVQIDIAPTRIGLRHPADVGQVGDAGAVLRVLLPLVEEKRDQAFLKKAQERMESWNKLMEERGTRSDMPMKPQGEQIAFEGNPQYGVELQPIDFAGVAMNCGAAGFTIENPRDAAGVLKEALAHRGPAVVQAVVDPNEPPMPGKVSTEQAIKFAEALLRGQKAGWDIIKTVVEDKVREVV